MPRTPKNYKGIMPTSKSIKDVLPSLLKKIDKKRSIDIKTLWKGIIGEKLAPMTNAVSLENKILIVKVKNSTLHSLLVNYEKGKIIKKIQKNFSKDLIKDIIFKVGYTVLLTFSSETGWHTAFSTTGY